MGGFSLFVSDLPSISLKALYLKSIKNAIKAYLSLTAFMSAPQPGGGGSLPGTGSSSTSPGGSLPGTGGSSTIHSTGNQITRTTNLPGGSQVTLTLVKGSPDIGHWRVGYEPGHYPEVIRIYQTIDTNQLRGSNGRKYLAEWLLDFRANYYEAQNNGVKFSKPNPILNHIGYMDDADRDIIKQHIMAARPDIKEKYLNVVGINENIIDPLLPKV